MSAVSADKAFPPQHQEEMPAEEARMMPQPVYEDPAWQPVGLLAGKTAVITGGDSGIGRAVAVLFAAEGADVVIAYLDEHEDAEQAKTAVEKRGRRCVTVAGDLSRPQNAQHLVDTALGEFGAIDLLVDNAAVQYSHERFSDESIDEITRTVETNLLGSLYVTRLALPHLKEGAAVIVSTSVTAYRGSGHLVTYSATKGALAALVRSLGSQLASDGIRVNGVAPGPVWTPLIVGSFSPEEVEKFGTSTPMGRAAQPYEVAPAYLFLASARWSGYVTGQVVHPNGGEAVNA